MVQCWCHAAMAGWLTSPAADTGLAAHGRMQRWRYECERAGGDCAARVEAVALRLPFSRALRSGPLLRLLTSAGPVEFLDDGGQRPTDHRYLGLLEPGLRHLVWRRGPEGVRFVTVGDACGEHSVFESLAQALRSLVPPSSAPFDARRALGL